VLAAWHGPGGWFVDWLEIYHPVVDGEWSTAAVVVVVVAAAVAAAAAGVECAVVPESISAVGFALAPPPPLDDVSHVD
jgi:hypothetical protein